MSLTSPPPSIRNGEVVTPLALAFPALAGGVPEDLLGGENEVELGSQEWGLIRDLLVDRGYQLVQLSIGELIPALLALEDWDLLRSWWLPHGVAPLRVRTRNALLRNGVLTWADVAALKVCDVGSWKNAGQLTVRDLIRLGVEIGARVTRPGYPVVGPEVESDNADRTSAYPTGQLVVAGAYGWLSGRDEQAALELLARWAAYSKQRGDLVATLEAASSAVAPSEVVAASKKIRALDISRFAGKVLPIQELIEQLLSSLPSADRGVFVARCLAADPSTLETLGQQLGVTRERVRQLQTRAERTIAERLQSVQFAPISWHARVLRAELGTLVPIDNQTTREIVSRHLGVVHSAVHLALLLRLAGPYRSQFGWWCISQSLRNLEREMAAKSDEFGLIPESALDVLAEAGVSPIYRECALESMEIVRRRAGRLVHWPRNVVDKVVTLLALRGSAASVETLFEEIDGGLSISGAKDRVRSDPRVVRVNRSEYGLRIWGLEEYSGIADEIVERIERNGGSTEVEQLVQELVTLFGVSEGSVRAYCTAPMFVIEFGMIRLRSTGESLVVSNDLSHARGIFRLADGIVMVVRVDRDVLRGSGRSVAPQVSSALGVLPGQERTFVWSGGAVRVTWPMTGWQGGSLGSIRDLILSVDARVGDRVRLRFEPDIGRISCAVVDEHIVSSGPSNAAIRELTGIDSKHVHQTMQILASAVDSDPGSVKRVLRDRGDEDVTRALPQAPLDASLLEALADLAKILDLDE